MKADPSAQKALLDLQQQDSALAHVAHRRTSLPELAELAACDQRLRELESRRIEAQTRVSDLERAQSKADAEVEQVKARRERDEQRLASGAITNPKDLTGLQSELEALARRIATLEDEELVIMEELESAQGELEEILRAIEVERAAQVELGLARDRKLAELDAEAAEAKAARERILPQIDPDLLQLYRKVAEQRGGLGVAPLVAGRCQGCHLEINSADLREIQAEPADAVVRCPECGRILVRGGADV